MAISRLKIISGTDCLNKTMKAGIAAQQSIEAKETNLVTKNTASQERKTKLNTAPNPGILKLNPIRTPNVVATPLPPLNLRKTVQLWPKIQLIPKIIRNISLDKTGTCINTKSLKKVTAKAPFKASNSNTQIPAFLPRIRKALVAPTLPDPNLRISIFFSNLPAI